MARAEYSFSPQARLDALEIFNYLAKDNVKTADDFLNELANTTHALAEMPGMGALRQFNNPVLHEARMMPVRGFHHHLIFYQLKKKQGIIVLRITHSARDLPSLLGNNN